MAIQGISHYRIAVAVAPLVYYLVVFVLLGMNYCMHVSVCVVHLKRSLKHCGAKYI